MWTLGLAVGLSASEQGSPMLEGRSATPRIQPCRGALHDERTVCSQVHSYSAARQPSNV
jgi:hypothetical protein